MRLSLLFFVILLFSSSSKAQKWSVNPDFAVQYISYFGIGSQSVQRPAVIGNHAANYALMQQALPEWTEQGLGVPVYFYKKVIESCGADQLIDALIADYKGMTEKDLKTRLQVISTKIRGATISKNLNNQLKNAVSEFYKGKKIRLSSSPNFLSIEKRTTFSVTTSAEDLGSNIVLIYASFWEFEAVMARFSNKELNQKKLAVGILVTQAFEYGYAIGRVQTDYTTKDPAINILSKRDLSRERIGFPRFDSKWYRTYEKAEKAPVFVDNAALTPSVRILQKAMIDLDPILRAQLPKSTITDKQCVARFTFIIIKNNLGKFELIFQQPELQLKE